MNWIQRLFLSSQQVAFSSAAKNGLYYAARFAIDTRYQDFATARLWPNNNFSQIECDSYNYFAFLVATAVKERRELTHDTHELHQMKVDMPREVCRKFEYMPEFNILPGVFRKIGTEPPPIYEEEWERVAEKAGELIEYPEFQAYATEAFTYRLKNGRTTCVNQPSQ